MEREYDLKRFVGFQADIFEVVHTLTLHFLIFFTFVLILFMLLIAFSLYISQEGFFAKKRVRVIS